MGNAAVLVFGKGFCSMRAKGACPYDGALTFFIKCGTLKQKRSAFGVSEIYGKGSGYRESISRGTAAADITLEAAAVV